MPRKCSSGSGPVGGIGAAERGLGRDVGRPVRERRLLAHGAERDPAEAALGELLEDERGVRRELDVEALGELREPGELVRHGRDHGAPQPLDAALEVDEGAVALEVARAGQDEVGPADGEALEHRDREHALGLLGEGAHGRVGRSLVAGDDQEPDRLRVLLVAVRAPAQASATPRPFGVAGRWKAAQPGFASSPSRWPSSASRAPPPPPRPDQIRTARSEADDALLELLAELRAPASSTISAPLRRACRIQRSTIGARSADLLLADHDDELGGADRRRAARGRRRAPCETASGSTAECAPRPWRSSLPSA